ncbi:hypothetical protein AE921_15345 [Xanthomonas arboricola]|nr:hypothetical protein AKJ12_20035 [Xanthomonas arboricola pv. juglandis]KOA98318.1 hypothetical protein AE921_15345 [Xanthomonas arboricola]PPU07226.1 hypothetical protein XacyCFBP2565_20455 [Xanthomonas arboricola pv. corylina]KOB00554.1 hypothetical protein AE920_08865 [Xanthomonas arboricola]KOB04999.1 hypothetical protein AE922_18935 [Xanthomonas arboricola]
MIGSAAIQRAHEFFCTVVVQKQVFHRMIFVRQVLACLRRVECCRIHKRVGDHIGPYCCKRATRIRIAQCIYHIGALQRLVSPSFQIVATSSRPWIQIINGSTHIRERMVLICLNVADHRRGARFVLVVGFPNHRRQPNLVVQRRILVELTPLQGRDSAIHQLVDLRHIALMYPADALVRRKECVQLGFHFSIERPTGIDADSAAVTAKIGDCLINLLLAENKILLLSMRPLLIGIHEGPLERSPR